MMNIRIYTHPKMNYTIFHQERTRHVLNEFELEFVNDPETAQVLIGSYPRLIRDMIESFGGSKRYLLWTHEPLFWTSTGKWTTIGGQRVRTMSLHSGEVFVDNYFYAAIKRSNPSPLPLPAHGTLNRKVICVATAKTHGHPDLVRRANGVDLAKTRYEVALAGHARGQLDVYGRFWPPGVSRGESRWRRWSLDKYDILQRYHFNLCFENSLVPFYCSEKIWQSIYCGCLPVYYGQETIYRDFPDNSFLDYARLGGPDALFDAVNHMTVEEFNERHHRCLRVFEKAFPRGDASREQAARYAALQIVALSLSRLAPAQAEAGVL
jgi:hypothetical protein